MKRWIHNIATNAAKARKLLDEYEPDKVEFVQDCYQAVLDDISDFYTSENDERPIQTSTIKRDYLIEAIEDDLMTEDEFNDIYALLETIGEEEAHSMA